MPRSGDPTGVLWAPWRMGYLRGLKRARSARRRPPCFLCAALHGHDDRSAHLVERGRLASCILNKYPYNNGHLMVIPNRHTANFAGLKAVELAAMTALAQAYIKALSKVISPDGWNLGINLGQAGGAGLQTHLHLHVVPRWRGDTNSFTTVSGTRVISQDLNQLWLLLRKARGLK